MSHPSPECDELANWHELQHLEAWAGEVRVNLLRLGAIAAFYGQHLLHYHFFNDGYDLTLGFHLSVTAVVVAWVMSVVALYCILSRRRLPAALPYASVLWDIVMIALVVALAGGPKDPLVMLWFLVIASAPLRLSLKLVYLATLGSIFAYFVVLGYYAWFQVGFERYYADAELRIPRSTQVIVALALAAAGFLAGQAVRQARRIGEPDRPDETAEA